MYKDLVLSVAARCDRVLPATATVHSERLASEQRELPRRAQVRRLCLVSSLLQKLRRLPIETEINDLAPTNLAKIINR